MAGRQGRPPWPLCAGLTKDGKPCRSVADKLPEGGPGRFCRAHQRQADRDAEYAAMLAAAELEPEAAPEPEPGPSVVEPAPEPVQVESLRAALRAGASTAEAAGLIGDLILDGLKASKDVYAVCRKCGTKTPVNLPDLNTRVSAASKLIEEIEGKQLAERSSADAVAAAQAKQVLHGVEALSDDELCVLAAGTDISAEVLAAARRIVEAHG